MGQLLCREKDYGSEEKPVAKGLKLPHNFKVIMKVADNPIDETSMEKLYEQLRLGVFLNKKKKYWVEKDTGRNCFMLFARDLGIVWVEDTRYYQWSSEKEGDVEVEVTEILDVCWLEVYGKFDMSYLTPGTTYEVVLIAMLREMAYGWEVPVNVWLSNGDEAKQERKENLYTKPKGQWLEIQLGEFRTSIDKVGDIYFGLHEYNGGHWKRGLVIKGVVIRPKK